MKDTAAPEAPPPGESVTPEAPPFAPGRDVWLVICLLVLAGAAFLPALSGDFVWEDRPLVVDSGLIRSPGDILAVFNRSFLSARPNSYHPLATLTYLTDFQVWRVNPVGYHTTNLTLHLIATLLVYVVGTQLLRRRDMAFAAGALFAVHPVHVQSVAWIAARPQLLATCFALFALLAYGHYVESFNNATAPRRRTRIRYWMSVVAFTLALFAHAAAAALVVLLPLYEVLVARRRLDVQKGVLAVRPYLGFAAGIGLYLLARWWALGYHLAVGLDVSAWPAYLYAMPLWGIRAIELLLLPVRSQPYLAAELISTPLRVDVIIAVAAIVVLVVLIVRVRSQSPAVAFASWWVLLPLGLVLNPLPLPAPQLAERSLYLPSAGIAIIVGWAVVSAADAAASRGRGRLRTLVILCFAGIIIAAASLSWSRIAWYREDITLFSHMARAAPTRALPHFNLGNAYLMRGDAARAIEEYRRAIAVRPTEKAYHNLGNAYLAAGRYEEAQDAYRRALALNPLARASATALTRAREAQLAEEGSAEAEAAPTGTAAQ
ncbi:MAG: tetratricopeptide repeat protein [Armatimonadota bacterium]|nr:MAG: tetratricopeptide repeat protein [Armatimonadota bacterium]